MTDYKVNALKYKLYIYGIILLFLGSFNVKNLLAKPAKPIKVDIWSGNALISNEVVQVRFSSNPLSITIKRGNQVVLRSANQKFLSANSGKGDYLFKGTNVIHRLYRGFRAELISPDDRQASLEVTMDPTGQIQIEVDPEANGTKGITVNLLQKAEEHYYGLGDVWHTQHVDLKGSKVVLWDKSGTPDECNWVPFYMSTVGYGIFIDNSYYGYINFGKISKNTTTIHFDAPSLSMHIWTGRTMKDILPQYLDYTGYPPVPPKWTFLPQKWRDEGNWDVVFKDVHMMKKNDMPLGAVWLDRPWMRGGYGSDDFIFDKQRYPEPKKHIQELHDMRIHVIVWGCDFLTEDSKYYKEGKRKHYFVGGSATVADRLQRHIIDFANPDARKWFEDIIKNALNLGVDGIKLDRGQEYPVSVTPPSGRDPKAMHNYHAYLMVKTYAEALQEVRGKDYLLIPRAGWAGTQRWSMKWPGDMKSNFSHDQGLPAVIRAQSDAGLTGFALWGSDIGGYSSKLSKNVFIRWLEAGTFSPLMEIPGKGNHKDAPFSWDKGTIKIYKFYAQLRKNMIPYLMDMARKAHTKGAPIVRHLAWNWPNDPHVHILDYEYMFGDDLLVAAVVKKTKTRKVYLPRGKWIDFWNQNHIITGPKTITVKVPLWKIPLFIHKGSKYKFERPDIKLP